MSIDWEELKIKGIYSYVSEHYYEMSKSQLKVFIQELSYIADYRKTHEPEVIDSIKEQLGDED